MSERAIRPARLAGIVGLVLATFTACAPIATSTERTATPLRTWFETIVRPADRLELEATGRKGDLELSVGHARECAEVKHFEELISTHYTRTLANPKGQNTPEMKFMWAGAGAGTGIILTQATEVEYVRERNATIGVLFLSSAVLLGLGVGDILSTIDTSDIGEPTIRSSAAPPVPCDPAPLEMENVQISFFDSNGGATVIDAITDQSGIAYASMSEIPESFLSTNSSLSVSVSTSSLASDKLRIDDSVIRSLRKRRISALNSSVDGEIDSSNIDAALSTADRIDALGGDSSRLRNTIDSSPVGARRLAKAKEAERARLALIEAIAQKEAAAAAAAALRRDEEAKRSRTKWAQSCLACWSMVSERGGNLGILIIAGEVGGNYFRANAYSVARSTLTPAANNLSVSTSLTPTNIAAMAHGRSTPALDALVLPSGLRPKLMKKLIDSRIQATISMWGSSEDQSRWTSNSEDAASYLWDKRNSDFVALALSQNVEASFDDCKQATVALRCASICANSLE